MSQKVSVLRRRPWRRAGCSVKTQGETRPAYFRSGHTFPRTPGSEAGCCIGQATRHGGPSLGFGRCNAPTCILADLGPQTRHFRANPCFVRHFRNKSIDFIGKLCLDRLVSNLLQAGNFEGLRDRPDRRAVEARQGFDPAVQERRAP